MQALRRQGGWIALALLLSSLELAACDDDDNCSRGIPSCAVGFDHYNAKTCTCERSPDAGTDGGAP